MKKLMFVAALAAVGSAFALESANVVGYANDALTSTQWKSVCSQFIKIGSKDGSDMKLGELIPGGPWGYGTDLIKLLTKDATLDFDAVYVTWDSLPPKQQKKYAKETFVNGWYKLSGSAADIEGGSINDTTIPAGSGFLAQSSTTGATITQPSAL